MAIVATGLVGSSIAFSLITQGVCEEILMIDLNEEIALWEAMDLNHRIEYLNRNTKVRAGLEVYNRKGTTYYGIATATVAIIKAIINDENRIMPVSTLLDGEYGEFNVFTGVPVVLNGSGVKEVVEIDMLPDELSKFKQSNDFIRKCIAELGYEI